MKTEPAVIYQCTTGWVNCKKMPRRIELFIELCLWVNYSLRTQLIINAVKHLSYKDYIYDHPLTDTVEWWIVAFYH